MTTIEGKARHDANKAIEDNAKWAIRTRCLQLGLPTPCDEYRFHSKRKWSFDLCWPVEKLALEIEGGVRTNGRHVRPAGYEADLAKYNEAICLGWSILRVTHQQVENDEAIFWVERAFTYLKHRTE